METSSQPSLFDCDAAPCASDTIPPLGILEDTSSSALPIKTYAAQSACQNPILVNIVSTIFNESFGFRPDGKPYRLGPKSVCERLQQTDFLFIAGDENSAIGYLFGKEIPSSQGRIAWIESMAVLPLYRRRGIATALIERFARATKGAGRVGCATPNPIAALLVTRGIQGKSFIGQCSPPFHIRHLLKEIRQYCFDLRGCLVNEVDLTIKTGFSPLSRYDQRQWSPARPIQQPPWWSWVENLPNAFEALLIIEREQERLSPSTFEPA